MKKPAAKWFVYMIECEGNRIYTGVAVDVEARFKKHCAGRGAAFTRINKPVRLLASKRCKSRGHALHEEYALKKLRKEEKVAWISRRGLRGEAVRRRRPLSARSGHRTLLVR